MRRSLLALALVLCTGACGEEAPKAAGPRCTIGDKPCYVRALKDHPSKRIDTWKAALAKPVEQRIGTAPEALVELITYDNLANNFPQRPKAGSPPAEFLADVRAAFATLPEPVKKLLGPKFAGLYFVEDLGGTGFTDMYYEDGKPAGGFIVLDANVLLKHTANSWASWRDGTPFKPSADERLEVTIEAPSDDTRRNAIQYILLHEIAHVLAVGAPFHPNWNTPLAEIGSTSGYPFFELTWRIAGTPASRYETIFDATFPQRKDIVYYFGPRIPADQIVATYEGLEKTNLVTLYSGSHPGDDFAEAFASYVHVVMMKKPFEIRLYQRDRLAKTYGACWEEPRCAPKRAILENLLKP